MKRNTAIPILIVALAGVFALSFLNNKEEENSGSVVISEAVASPMPGSSKGLMLVLKIEGEGPPQKIISVTSPDAKHVMYHGVEGAENLIIPANSKASLSMDGAHLMLHGFEGEITDGRLVTIKMDFDSAESVTTKARVSIGSGSGHAGHGATYKVPDSEIKPAIALNVEPETNGTGWNINAEVTDFKFDKQAVDRTHVPGTGHGHIYLNGLKLGRVFERTTAIGMLPKGTHLVRVTLNTNDHRVYIVDGRPVTATAEIVVE